ncbi:MAG: murein biosynthesis integral membrane protein MurJ [Candidatus Omnitrophica bacterium]|nr:murein biosynthesis integral membrane protein MurJ [Candidatus Omnitrophota bacterium]
MSTDKTSHHKEHKAIAKSAGVIGFATFCSRVLGFIRDIIIARLFGVYIYAQAFVIAFKIPNLFRDLVGEGASNAAIVPVFSEYNAKHTKEEFWELANVVLNLLLVVVSLITILGIIFSPVIVRLIAPGFIAFPDKLEVTIRLNRIIFPYILLISLAAYSMGILNSLKHFAVPAFAPCLLNISIIVFALLFGEGIKGLALGVLVGGVLQLAIQIPVLYKKGFRLNLFKRFKHPAAKTIGKLMVPRVFSSGIYQLNNFVDSIFGSLAWIVGDGGVAVLYFSYRLIQFPLGIFSFALSQAILPTFSVQALEDDLSKLRKTLSWGLRAIAFVLIPASAAFMSLSKIIVTSIFQGGRFDTASSILTADALFYFSIGLFAYGATKVLQSCFFALKDTVTPMKLAFLALILNIILNFVFMYPLKIAGIALATSISGTVTFVLMVVLLKKKLGDFEIARVINSLIKILAASICMGVVCVFISKYNFVCCVGYVGRFVNLGIILLLGFISYIVFCFIFRVSEMRDLYRWVLKKRSLECK